MLLVSQRLDSPRMDPLLPGVKRKLTGAVDGATSVNGVSDTSMTQSSAKRLCLEDVTLAMGPSYPQHPFPSGTGMGNQGGGIEGNRLNSNNNGSPYTMPSKTNPGTTAIGSGNLAPAYNPNGNSTAPSVEQELQDILDELTKNPDPSLPELDIEKILGNKVDEQTGCAGSFANLEGSGTPKRSPQRASHLEAHLTQSPGFPQAGSPQMGPSPTGAPYTLPHPSKPVLSPLSASPLSSSSSQNQARSPMLSAALSNRSTSNWREVSRAQQLQQMASNSKHHSTSSGQPQAQSGLPSLGQQGSSWAGPSPPYRPGDKLPNSSPHQQPFSPASSIQSPQSSLISSITPAPSAGPSPPYRPEKLASPALAQPPFSPQNPLLSGGTPSGGSTSTVQGSQANYLSGISSTSSSTRPSPPYRPEKQHTSPAGPTQPGTQPSTQGCPFNSQNSQAPNMSSQLYKAITASQPSSNSLKILMQQSQTKSAQMQLSKSTPCNMGPETFSLNNTKPLRHFDPDPHASKMGPIPLGGFHNGSMQSIPPPSATGHIHLLQQRMQRGMQADSMLPHCGEEQNVGMVPHLQDPSAGPRPGQANNYNMLLRTQLMRKQEKQRQLEQMNEGQMPDCQQVAQFQGPGRTLPPELSGYPMGAPQHPNPTMMSHNSSILPNRMNLPPGSLSQVGHSGPYMGGTGPKQPFYHSSQDLVMPMRASQSLIGVGGAPRQPTHPGHIVARPGMPGPSLGGGPTNHLRQALHQGASLPPRMMCASQQQQHSQSQLWQGQQRAHPHMDPVNHQHLFPSGGASPVCGAPQFTQRPGMPANFSGARPPPNQLAPGMVSRHMQKMPPGQILPSLSQHNLRMRGPLTTMEMLKPGGPGMMDPAHGMAPPSYPSVDKHSLTQGYSSGQNPGSKLPSYDYPPQHQSNGSMAVGPQGPVGVGGGEVDFIDTLVGSNDDWLNNLNMIDEYLEQNS